MFLISIFLYTYVSSNKLNKQIFFTFWNTFIIILFSFGIHLWIQFSLDELNEMQ